MWICDVISYVCISVDVAPVIIPETAEFQLGATNDILSGIYTTEPVTDQQLHMNKEIDLLNESVTKVADFLNQHFVKISSIKKESELGGRGTIEQQGKKFKGYHTYLRSTEYRSACISLFRPRSVNSLLSGSLITEVRKYVLNEKQTAQQEAIVIQSIPVSGHGKVRYVGKSKTPQYKFGEE